MALEAGITALAQAVGSDMKGLNLRVSALEALGGVSPAPATDIPAPTEIMVKQNGVWLSATLAQFIAWVTVTPNTVTVQGTALMVNGEKITVNGV